LCVLFYLYLWQVVDLRLIAHGAGIITNFPVFYTGWSYFEQFLRYPGGIVEYGGSFFSQLFYVGWAGAAVATVQAWLTCTATDFILKRFGLPSLRWLRFVPALILLGTYTSYSFHFVTATALTTSLLFVCLYLVLTKQGRPQQASQTARSLIAFAVLSLILYTVAGGAYLVFAGIVILHEVVQRRGQIAVACLLFGAVLPYIEGVWAFSQRPANAYGALLPYPWEKFALQGAEEDLPLAYALYLFLPAALLVGALGQLATRLPGKRTRALLATIQRGRELPANVRAVLASLTWVVAGAAVVFATQDRERKVLFTVDYCSHRRMWPQVLETAGRYPTTHWALTNAVDRALYHTGRLPYDAFSYPQHPDALLLTGEDRVLHYWHKFDTLIDLGLLNLAEKNLTESIAIFGEQPFLLKRLASINLAKKRTGAARIYLHTLTKTLFHDDWARDTLARLGSDPNLTADPRIDHLRRVHLTQDSTTGFYSRESLLQALLETNRCNRMAFEYLMTSYLLNRQLNRFVGAIERLNDFEYTEVPRLYQEAVLIYMYGTKRPVRLPGRSLDPERRRQIEDFSRIYRSHHQDKRAAFAELAERYGDSYFFYHMYGFSPRQK